ncbi:hypothetical protein [Streptosporangium vulgare]|uniref:Uncharacterized protein n=1 Tax=Streptosporangium vulgare TaxID=46190 RepID=A0ABV5TST8_9ACTN
MEAVQQRQVVVAVEGASASCSATRSARPPLLSIVSSTARPVSCRRRTAVHGFGAFRAARSTSLATLSRSPSTASIRSLR